MIRRSIVAVALGCLTAACGGDGADFELTSNLPRTELIEAFAELAHSDSMFYETGVVTREVKLERPNPGELLFAIPSSESETDPTFHLSFVDGETPNSTIIRVKIDVPEITIGNKVLSEEKVENDFEKNATHLIEAVRAGTGVKPATHKLSELFFTLVLMANPEDRRKVEQAVAKDNKGWRLGWGEEAPADEEENSSSAAADERPATKPGWEKPTWGSAR